MRSSACAGERAWASTHTRLPKRTCVRVDRKKAEGCRAIMVDSITSSFSEYGVLASELVGFVSEWDRVSRADGRKKREKEEKERRKK